MLASIHDAVTDRNPLFIARPPPLVNNSGMNKEMDLVEEYIERAGITDAEFCRRLKINPQNLQHWKVRGISKRMLPKVAEVIGVSLDELVGRKKREVRRYVDNERLQRALEQLQRNLGTSGLDVTCLGIAMQKVDKIAARKAITYAAKARMYQLVYDELLRDKNVSDQVVADIIKGLLQSGNDKDGEL